jgi:hypothetical protein
MIDPLPDDQEGNYHSRTDTDKDSNSSDGDDHDEESIRDSIGEEQLREQRRLLTEIAQSTQDASDELRLMNDNIQDLTREVHGIKEAIKSLTEMLRKYMDNRS